MEKKALGKGLEALLPVSEFNFLLENQEVRSIQVDQIVPNRSQPRGEFQEDEIEKLADSIRVSGLLQPVVVRRKGDGLYELIAGERRWRAAPKAGLTSIPATVRNCNDEQAMVLALIENLQRLDLNPMETARAYNRMMTEFGVTQDHIAQQIGKDRSSVANLIRLTNLPNEIKELVESGTLSTGHAKVILGLSKPEEQIRLARRIVDDQLTVRQTEKMVETDFRGKRGAPKPPMPRQCSDLEERIQKRLGTKVTIQQKKGQGGKIVIHYFSPPELERVLEALLG